MAFTYITAKPYPIENMVVGSDWKELVPIYQVDRTSAWDFTDWTAYAEVREVRTNSLLCTFKNTGTPPLTLQFDGGDMYLIALKADTVDYDPDKDYVWDCKFTDTDGVERTLILESPFKLCRTITGPTS